MSDRKKDLLAPDFEPTDEELREIEDAFAGAVLREGWRLVSRQNGSPVETAQSPIAPHTDAPAPD